jgi:hypothetical protein
VALYVHALIVYIPLSRHYQTKAAEKTTTAAAARCTQTTPDNHSLEQTQINMLKQRIALTDKDIAKAQHALESAEAKMAKKTTAAATAQGTPTTFDNCCH